MLACQRLTAVLIGDPVAIADQHSSTVGRRVESVQKEELQVALNDVSKPELARGLHHQRAYKWHVAVKTGNLDDNRRAFLFKAAK